MKGFISVDLWHKFKLAELDQVMRQDHRFVNLLNKIRQVEIDWNVEHIKSRFIDKNDPHYSGDVLHIFVENAPVTRHNSNQLKQVPGELVKIQAKDQLPKNSDISDAKQAQKRKQPWIFTWIENQCQGYVNNKYKHWGSKEIKKMRWELYVWD